MIKKIAFKHDGNLLTFEVGKPSAYEPSKIVAEIRRSPSGAYEIIHEDGDTRYGATDAVVEEDHSRFV